MSCQLPSSRKKGRHARGVPKRLRSSGCGLHGPVRPPQRRCRDGIFLRVRDRTWEFKGGTKARLSETPADDPYRCFLPDLAGFGGRRRSVPGRQSHKTETGPFPGNSAVYQHGGERGIRTLDTPCGRIRAFQARSFSLSDISPQTPHAETPPGPRRQKGKNSGTPSTTRTCGLRTRNPTLYPTELWALLDVNDLIPFTLRQRNP